MVHSESLNKVQNVHKLSMIFQIFENYYLNKYVGYYDIYNIWAANWSCGLAFTLFLHYRPLHSPQSATIHSDAKSRSCRYFSYWFIDH